MTQINFTPMTDEDILTFKNRNLLPDGDYPFTVVNLTPGVSKAGNKKVVALIGVIDANGTQRNIQDHIPIEGEMSYKWRNLCIATGFEEEYKAGTIDTVRMLGRCGTVKIAIKKGDKKNDTEFYSDQNVIKNYLKSETANASEPLPDDEIPF